MARLGEVLAAEQGVIPPGVKLFATDFATAASGFADNINLTVADVPDGTSVRDAYAALAPRLGSAGLKVSGHRNVTAGGLAAVEASYTYQAGAVSVQGTQIYIVKGTKFYTVTLSQRVRDAAVAATVLDGVHFTS